MKHVDGAADKTSPLCFTLCSYLNDVTRLIYNTCCHRKEIWESKNFYGIERTLKMRSRISCHFANSKFLPSKYYFFMEWSEVSFLSECLRHQYVDCA